MEVNLLIVLWACCATRTCSWGTACFTVIAKVLQYSMQRGHCHKWLCASYLLRNPSTGIGRGPGQGRVCVKGKGVVSALPILYLPSWTWSAFPHTLRLAPAKFLLQVQVLQVHLGNGRLPLGKGTNATLHSSGMAAWGVRVRIAL